MDSTGRIHKHTSNLTICKADRSNDEIRAWLAECVARFAVGWRTRARRTFRQPAEEVSYLVFEAEPRSLSSSARMANAVAVSDMNKRRHGSPFSPPCSRS